MNSETALLTANIVLILLTLIVAIRMIYVRITEIKNRKINPQSLALAQKRDNQLVDSRASDNYNNLLELPLLFYVLSLLALITDQVTPWFTIQAWLFVISRCIHSYIQCSYNWVIHRFVVFAFGLLLIFTSLITFIIS